MTAQILREPLLRGFNGAALYAEADQSLRSLARDFSRTEAQEGGVEAQHQNTLEGLQAYHNGGRASTVEKPFAQVGSTAIISISGVLLNRFSLSLGYATGYNAIRSQMNAALGDPSVKGILLDVDSPGGHAAGCFELCRDIRAANEQKPVLAYVDSMAFSAAYAIASSAGRIIAGESASLGSIGVVAMHVSYAKMLQDEGVDVTFIIAGEKKVDGNPYEALSERARASIQAGVDRYYTRFLETVSEGRGDRLTMEKARETEAGIFDAQAAVALGLADAIMSADQAFQDFNAQSHEEPIAAMTTQNPAPAAQNTVDENAVRTAERARVSGIIGHAEAKGREDLANHLATNTDMSVEDAAKVLAVSPKAAPAAAAVDPLANAMNGTPQPNIQPGGNAANTGGGNGEPSAADRILASYAAATGAPVGKTH